MDVREYINSLCPGRARSGLGPPLYVSTAIPHFIPLEMRMIHPPGRFRSLAASGEFAAISVLRMETVIYVTSKIRMTVEPRAGADENPVIKPFRTVVAGRSAIIGSHIIVSIRTFRSDPNRDAYLSLGFRHT